VADSTYYCRMNKHLPDIEPGVYSYRKGDDPVLQLLLRLHSDTVWWQGPKGGVKVIKDKYFLHQEYITKNEELMKEFMWVKLQSQSIKGA